MEQVQHLTRTQLAKRLGVTVRLLEIWQEKGEGPTAMQLGPRTVRYSLADVLAYEEQSKIRLQPVDPSAIEVP